MSLLGSILDPGGLVTGDADLGSVLDPAGSFLNDIGMMPDFYGNAMDSVNDSVNDIVDFEKFQLDEFWKRMQDDPSQLLTGVDPFSTKVWNEVTGSEKTPWVNQYGGPTQEMFNKANQKGIDTGASAATHGIAQAIASYYGGQGLGKLFNAAGASMNVGPGISQAVGRGATGAANAWVNDGNVWEGALRGGASSMGNFNMGEGLGIDPEYQQLFNAAARGGIGAALNGGKVDTGTYIGLLKGAGNMFGGSDMPDTGTIGGTMEDEYGETSATLGGQQHAAQAQANQDFGGSGFGQMYSSPQASPQQAQQGGFNMDSALNTLGTLGTLYGQYQNYQTANNYANELASMYGPNSPYARQLRNQLARRDAASGRRSQYGPREVEFQAKMAAMANQIAPNVMNARNTGYSSLMQMLGTAGMANKQGMFDPLKGWLGSMYNPSLPTDLPQYNYNLNPADYYAPIPDIPYDGDI